MCVAFEHGDFQIADHHEVLARIQAHVPIESEKVYSLL